MTGYVIARRNGIKWWLRATNPPTWSAVRADAIVWRTEAEARENLKMYPNLAAAQTPNYAIEQVEIDAEPTGRLIAATVRAPAKMSHDQRCQRLKEVGNVMLKSFVGLTDDVRTYAEDRRDAGLSAIVADAISSCEAELEFLRFESEA